MPKKSDKPKSPQTATIEYVRWVHPEPRAVIGYGILEPGSVHRVADLPGDPLQQLGVLFEAAEGPENQEVKHE